MNPEYIRRVNHSYSDRFSRNQLIPRILPDHISKDKTILDFGAGKKIHGTEFLRGEGFNITAYDIGENFNPKFHDPDALKKIYDVVFASNVINIQPSSADVSFLIRQVNMVLKTRGLFFFNYPRKPRYVNLSNSEIETILRAGGFSFEKISKEPLIWKCTKGWFNGLNQ